MENQEKVLIYIDQSEKQQLQLKFNVAKDALQSVVDAYNRIIVTPASEDEERPEDVYITPLTEERFHQLFTDSATALFDILTGGTPLSIGGMELEAGKALELIKKPAGYNEFINDLEYLQANKPNGYVSSITIKKYFTVDATGKAVQFTKATLDTIDCAGQKYASTDRAIAMHKFAEEVIALFKEKGLDKAFGNIGSTDSIVTVLRNSITSINWADGSWRPNYGYLSGV